jgi:hypothetical protein
VVCDAVVDSIRRMLELAGADRKQSTQAEAERALDAGSGEEKETAPAAGTGPDTAQHPDPFEGIEDEDDIRDNYLSMFRDEADASLGGGNARRTESCEPRTL